MIEFIYSNELKKKYVCYGHFYSLNINKKLYKCRSVLEIFDKSIEKELLNNSKNGFYTHAVDLLVIMMNPGSSRPIQECEICTYNKLNIDKINKNYVLTRPDNTQYQIMRLMKERNLTHTRVINVTDLVETKSYNLVKKVFILGDNNYHSIFNDLRFNELKKCLNFSKNILLAWGKVKGLQDLYSLAYRKIPNTHKKYGYRVDGSFSYFHPSPMNQKHKIRWLEYVINNFEN